MRCLLLLALLWSGLSAAAWFSQPVVVDGQLQVYQPASAASEPWRICVLIPNAKDRYWWGVAWGLQQEAQRLGVRLGIYEAGGYDHPEVQVRQFDHCVNKGADGFLIAGINPSDLCSRIAVQQSAGRPVIDMVNGLGCETLSSRSRVDFADMASATLAYLIKLSNGRPIRVGWLPGPADAGWIKDAERGLNEALQGTVITLVHGGYGPLDRSRQAKLVRELFKTEPPLDYLIGNAEAALFATELAYSSGSSTQILSVYATDRVLQQIRSGRVLAAPTDSPVIQARIALDLAVRGLQGERLPRLISPQIEVLDAAALERFDLQRLAPPARYRMTSQELPN
ncbi:TMAO reductase system periplasmic protein TorT [Pseudomonas sp. MM211]|uniref:TMAO reductase system periplasmic protein TorT n=1 Tax=Pseudomonas sp. MM211 TaxID=2866808 RepID=UPI001CEDCEF9|nr:TMAO reductase system periplasmic protein TorT [Pseudomonas sp. MM211]UCJ17271.1 TMAO reductase system periplasmic protein TorT [Pseudomonas sp. MM211]